MEYMGSRKRPSAANEPPSPPAFIRLEEEASTAAPAATISLLGGENELIIHLEQIGRKMARASDFTQLGQALRSAFDTVLHPKCFALYLRMPRDGSLRLINAGGLTDEERLAAQDSAGHRLPGTVLRTGCTHYTPDIDTTTLPAHSNFPKRLALRGLAFQPVIVQEQPVGALGIGTLEPIKPLEQVLTLLAFIARMVATAYERIQREAGLRMRNAVLSALPGITQRLLSQSWQVAVGEALSQLGEALEVSRILLYENELQPGEKIEAGLRGEWLATDSEGVTLKALSWDDSRFRRWRTRLQRGENLESLVEDLPRVEAEGLNGLRSLLVVPVFAEDEWWGALWLDDSQSDRIWTDAERAALKTAASTLGAAILHSRTGETLYLQGRMLDTVAEAVFATDDQGILIYWNRYAEQLLGWRSRAVLGRPLTSLKLGDKARAAFKQAQQRLQHQGIHTGEVDLRTLVGLDVSALCTAAAVHNAQTHSVAHIWALVDISELRQTQRIARAGARRLTQAFEGVVGALGAIVASRDPATALHQQRVAELSLALAQEMDLPQDRSRACWLAAQLHDVGLLGLPIEKRRGELDAEAQRLLQRHPAAGHDILEPLGLPWPLEEIVLQHHERYDGSGYPQHLKGEAIMLEARIIAVADHFELRSPAGQQWSNQGTGEALKSLKRERGRALDPRVATACLRLFRDRRFFFTTVKPEK